MKSEYAAARACITNSLFKQRIHTDVIHRPHDLVGVGTAVISLPLTDVRERSADWRTILVWHLGEGARVPCEARRLPALHCGVFHPGTVSSGPNRRLSSPVIRAAFAVL